MLHLKLRRNIADAFTEPRKLTLAERFGRVLALLTLEYDLDLDVVAEAERQLRTLRARELN
jgi:hypothetical protein